MILKHERVLKDVFLTMIADSSYPAVTMNDVTNFTTQTKLLDDAFKLSDLDRFYKAAYFKPPENPQF